MHHNKTDIQGATNWVNDYHKELEAKFMDLYENKIPKFGEPVDTELVRYVDGLANWVRAVEQWGFESERYFGKKGPEIGKSMVGDAVAKGTHGRYRPPARRRFFAVNPEIRWC